MATVSPSPLLAAAVDGTIWLLWVILSAIDVVLVAVQKLASFADFITSDKTRDDNANDRYHYQQFKKKGKPARIVIVGASFAGLGAYRDLLRHRNSDDEIDITVIDYKNYFEYTPGILRCFVEPQHLSSLTSPLSVLNKRQGSRFIQSEVVGIDAVTQTVALNNGNQIPYDYLIVATGSTYPGPVKATTSQSTLAQRQLSVNQSAQHVKSASTIIIVGGGAVGVELAAEIVDRFPNREKRVIIVDAAATILPGFRQHSVNYAMRWLEDNGVELFLDASLERIDDVSVTFADGTKLSANIVFKCFGAAPAMPFAETEIWAGSETQKGILVSSRGRRTVLSEAMKGPKGSISVNNHLQVMGFKNVFSAGDVCFHSESNELKLAHTAHVNASLVAFNVLRMVRKAKEGVDSTTGRQIGLLSYPDFFGNKQTPKIYNISLGRYDASLGFNALVMNGPLPAVIKWLIEWTQVAAAANRPVGLWFWIVADWASFFLGRTILMMPEPAVDSKKAQ